MTVSNRTLHLSACQTHLVHRWYPSMLSMLLLMLPSAPAVVAEYEAAHQQHMPQREEADALQQLARETAAAAGTDADGTERAAAAYAFGDRELPPVNAVVGGLLANEVLKALSHKGEPVNNWYFYSLASGVGQIETTRPQAV